jgi:hypothetical protein
MLPIIDILLDGKRVDSLNHWSWIPRVGDTVMLKNGEVFSDVVRVVWADDSALAHSKTMHRQWVQLVCETTNARP